MTKPPTFPIETLADQILFHEIWLQHTEQDIANGLRRKIELEHKIKQLKEARDRVGGNAKPVHDPFTRSGV